MPSPIRQQLIADLFTRLKTIQIANGYQTDIGRNGFRWKASEFAPINVPGFTLNDVDQVSTEAPSGFRGYVLNLEILVALAAATSTADTLILADTDIFKCVGLYPFFANIAQLGQAHIHYNGTEFAVQHQETIISGLKAKYEIRYRTKLWDPFTT